MQDSGSRVHRAAVHTQTHEHEKHRNKDEHSVGHNKEATQHDISRFPAFRVCAYVYEALRVFSDYFCPRNREMPNSCNYPVFCLLVSRDPFARSLVARGPVAKGPVARPPVARGPVAKGPVARGPVATAPLQRSPNR